MTEKEMEDLLWEYPEKFLNEPLTRFKRQPVSGIGRADLVFIDRLGRFLAIQIRHGVLGRAAVDQLVDYLSVLKRQFPDRPVELMVVANVIPPERRLACEQYYIEACEIPESRFREVAEDVGYTFLSELTAAKRQLTVKPARLASWPRTDSAKMERGWYYWRSQGRGGLFLVFVNARGRCSMRRFDADSGLFMGKEHKSGDYREGFADYVRVAMPLSMARQPNLARDCKQRLPDVVLSELQQQIDRRSA